MHLITFFLLFFIAFIGWSLALGLIYFIVYIKRENTALKRALLDKYASKQSSDLKDRLVEQMKLAHNRMQEVTDDVNEEIAEVQKEILQAQAIINQEISQQTPTYVDEKTFNKTLETYNLPKEKPSKIKH